MAILLVLEKNDLKSWPVLHTEGQPEINQNEAGAIIDAQVHFVEFHQPILEQVFK